MCYRKLIKFHERFNFFRCHPYWKRQVGREHGKNLIESDFDEINLKRNIMLQLDHGKYSGADIYGDGNAAKKIVNHLINLKPDLQKMISYIDE